LLSRRRRFGPSLALPPIVSKALLLLLMFELSRWPRTPLSRPSERQKVGSAYLSRCSDFAPENFSGYFLAASMATPATRDREHLRSHHGWRLPKLPGVPERELRSCGRAASAASSRRFRQCLHRSSPPNHQTPTIALTLRLWRKHPDYGGKQWQVSEQNKSSSQLDAR